MSRDQVLQTRPSPFAATAAGRPLMPVLIQVPYVPALVTGTGRPSYPASPRARVRPRRRLRREVRMAGYGLLAAAPLVLLALGFWGGRQSALGSPSRSAEAAAGRADLARSERPPSVSITIEPAGLAPRDEVAPPVVLPGYLLPDDSPEEPVHAGS